MLPLSRRISPMSMSGRLWIVACAALTYSVVTHVPSASAQDKSPATSRAASDAAESALLTNIRQLTFEGRRAGEGYFDRSGTQMVFQSERSAGNPFFQIYLMDLTTGDVERVSPGFGKTTCAWIHPQGDQVMFASTQSDPEAEAKQKAELQMRAEGKQRRYSWDYDEHYELTVWNRKTKKYHTLTNQKGYDAEGSWSPDGGQIVFASNRRAYTEKLTEKEREQFKIDPAYMMDIYVMNADGSDVRRLTEAPGYDGGPFFSPDGKRICWRAILARRRHGGSDDNERRRQRQASADEDWGHVLGAVLPSHGQVSDLHHQPSRLRQLRAVHDRRRRPT